VGTIVKDREQFMQFFKEPISPTQIRWDSVADGPPEYGGCEIAPCSNDVIADMIEAV
jgi:hypothetical protein